MPQITHGKIRLLTYFPVALLLLQCWSSTAFGQTISFNQAWARLLQSDDSIAAEHAGVDRAQFLKEAAKGLYWPQVNVGASYTRLDKPVELDARDLNPLSNHRDIFAALNQLINTNGNPFVTRFTEQNVVTSSVQVVWPLFTGGRIDAAQSIRSAQVNEAEQMLTVRMLAQFEALAQTYYGVVMAHQVMKTRQDIEKGMAQHYDHARKLEAQGQIARVEVLSAQSAYDMARIETQKARRSMETTEMVFAKLIKTEGATPSSSLFVNKTLPELPVLVKQTLNTHPGLKVLSAKRDQAKDLIRIERAKYAPDVFLFGNYQLYEQDTLAARTTPDWMVGVGVSVPLISREGRSDTIAAAKSAEMQVNYLEADMRQNLEIVVESTWREARLALEEFNSLSSTEKLTEENVQLRNKAFMQGMSTSLDVVDALNQLAGAKTQRASAAYRYVVSIARLMAISGQINRFSDYQTQHAIQVTP
ncbi:TolC family protein [Pectobacterium polaris]|uniref:TolC family protein n=1 Tax=Pectobacterium polaris TaxID=2042057 RepID=UPI0023AED0DC|nr:TolC family protein [Pectobacterium polaris]MDE8743004.1 TolC family protein [Pectobacterium polaris]